MLSRMSSNDTTRAGDVARIRRVLERLHSPRLQMMFIVSLTGAVGFLTSVGLLRAGMESMAARYSLAVAAAYLGFLFFLWCWLRFKVEDFDPTSDLLNLPDLAPLPKGSFPAGGGDFGGGGASHSFADSQSSGSGSGGVDFDLDLGELAVVLLVIVALAGALWAAIATVWTAPGLLAELLLDAGLSAGLYERVRHVRGDAWLRTAFAKTALPFVGVAVLFAVAGATIQWHTPEARSIGGFIRSLDQG